MNTKRRHKTGPRALVWGLGFLVLFQVAIALVVECCLPEVRDNLFAEHLQQLQARRHEGHGRPLVLVLGSSRPSLGVDAGRLNAALGPGGPLVYNFSIQSTGPMMQLVYLDRLLKEGIRPDCLVLEFFPLLFNQPRDRPVEETWPWRSRVTAGELLSLKPYHTRPLDAAWNWLRERGTAGLTQRSKLASILLGRTSDNLPAHMRPVWPIDRFGFQAARMAGDPAAQRPARTKLSVHRYLLARGNYRLAEGEARAYHDLLDRCRQHAIPTVLLIMPESTAFHEAYKPGVRPALDQFARDMSQQSGYPLIDARDWVPDDHFWDGHHLLPSGARIFTDRFASEFLQPLVWQGKIGTTAR